MPPEALIFDCDGTLVDSMPVHYGAWAETFARYGIDFTEARFYQLAGTPTDKVAQIVATEQGKQLDPVAVSREKDRQFMRLTHLVRPRSAVVAIVRKNRGVLPMAVASGSARVLVEKELRELGMIDWFDAILCAEDVPRHKPEPDIFLAAAERLGVAPERCRVYEDADLGIEAAKRAGMAWVDVRMLAGNGGE